MRDGQSEAVRELAKGVVSVHHVVRNRNCIKAGLAKEIDGPS
jgi:hypothetical protein